MYNTPRDLCDFPEYELASGWRIRTEKIRTAPDRNPFTVVQVYKSAVNPNDKVYPFNIPPRYLEYFVDGFEQIIAGRRAATGVDHQRLKELTRSSRRVIIDDWVTDKFVYGRETYIIGDEFRFGVTSASFTRDDGKTFVYDVLRLVRPKRGDDGKDWETNVPIGLIDAILGCFRIILEIINDPNPPPPPPIKCRRIASVTPPELDDADDAFFDSILI